MGGFVNNHDLAKQANEQLTISIETFPGTIGCTAFERLCAAKALIETLCYSFENQSGKPNELAEPSFQAGPEEVA